MNTKSSILWKNVQWCSALKNIITSSKKTKRIKIRIVNTIARNFSSECIPKITENRDLNRYLYAHIHGTIFHNSQKVEATYLFTDEQRDK